MKYPFLFLYFFKKQNLMDLMSLQNVFPPLRTVQLTVWPHRSDMGTFGSWQSERRPKGSLFFKEGAWKCSGFFYFWIFFYLRGKLQGVSSIIKSLRTNLKPLILKHFFGGKSYFFFGTFPKLPVYFPPSPVKFSVAVETIGRWDLDLQHLLSYSMKCPACTTCQHG